MDLVNEPKTKRGMETLDRIAKSAEFLFSEKGYFDTSIVDIARDAEVAQGTIYIYFKDKKSIFQYLVKNLGQSLRDEIRSSIKNKSTRYNLEYIGLKTFLDFVKDHVGIFKIIWQAQFVDMGLFTEYYEEFSKSYIRGIKKAQEDGEMRDLDPQVLSYCFIGIANFIALKYIIFDDNDNYDEIIKSAMDFIENGAFKKN
ncbi:TetR/AcrR family transcriptional regulator [Tissierella sp. Yu-01]|uniref:TetR/AcrR family transcriptional regulator n=1 Tax=Tissierella sp. Yu-01 TaxID=3035694 RepID=UPI00240D3A1D|nr:TetR/AcrR family transcriptional regulator [Tissierella sp. Yu-01]WFA10034.1 TetR/AcrR family transcriptional regulator [Tissierella sp. Yu-01]